MDVAEFGMPVTKISDLCLAKSVKAMVAFARISLLVLPLAVCDAEASQEQDTNLTTQVDSMTNVVFWCILECIGPVIMLVMKLYSQ